MRWLIPLVILGLSDTGPVRAELVSLDGAFAAGLGGRVFGQAGSVRKWTGTATIRLNPSDPHNAVITDLDRVPPGADGTVQAVTDLVILRPERPNGTLLFEVLNRGRKLLPAWTQDTGQPEAERLDQASDAGTGFLLEQGFTLVWAAWQGDVSTPMGVRLPVAAGVTGPSRDEFSLPPGPGPHTVRLAYSMVDGSPVQFGVRPSADAVAVPLDAPRVLGPASIAVSPAPGQPAGALYTLNYTATDPAVMGMGLAVIRDVVTFLRRDESAMNPLADAGRNTVTRTIGLGISQSGRVLRDFLYLGLNQDERGRIVFDGAMPIIPGARRSFTNARFAQPGRNPGPQYDRGYPVLAFPFTYPVLDDPISGRRDGILMRCRLTNTCPRIIHMDSEFEFWGSQASLLVTDPAGLPVAMPDDVRLYLATGTPHANAADAVMMRVPGCVLPVNPHSSRSTIRALLVAMQEWLADGRAPPPSRYPGRAEGTLVPAADAYRAAPGLGDALGYQRRVVGAGSYPVFVPLSGPDGNAVAGVRAPIVAVPRATYTGWNPLAGLEGGQDLCTQLGGVVPLPATDAAARAAGDGRPSLEALYPGPNSYERAVAEAADALVQARLLLPADAAAAGAGARAGTLAKLGQ